MRGGHTPPNSERILNDTRGRHAGIGGKAQIPWMAFRVVLDEIWMTAIEEMADHFIRQISAKIGVTVIGVEVEVETEEAVFARQPCLRSSG